MFKKQELISGWTKFYRKNEIEFEREKRGKKRDVSKLADTAFYEHKTVT